MEHNPQAQEEPTKAEASREALLHKIDNAITKFFKKPTDPTSSECATLLMLLRANLVSNGGQAEGDRIEQVLRDSTLPKLDREAANLTKENHRLVDEGARLDEVRARLQERIAQLEEEIVDERRRNR